MSLSKPFSLILVATAIATISIGFGINAIARPDHGLTFFAFQPPVDAALHRMVDSLMAIYGIRDIFMGLVIYATAYYGSRRALGWTLILNSAVAFADGAVCWTHGQGQWAHWGYAPLIAVTGTLILGVDCS